MFNLCLIKGRARILIESTGLGYSLLSPPSHRSNFWCSRLWWRSVFLETTTPSALTFKSWIFSQHHQGHGLRWLHHPGNRNRLRMRPATYVNVAMISGWVKNFIHRVYLYTAAFLHAFKAGRKESRDYSTRWLCYVRQFSSYISSALCSLIATDTRIYMLPPG